MLENQNDLQENSEPEFDYNVEELTEEQEERILSGEVPEEVIVSTQSEDSEPEDNQVTENQEPSETTEEEIGTAPEPVDYEKNFKELQSTYNKRDKEISDLRKWKQEQELQSSKLTDDQLLEAQTDPAKFQQMIDNQVKMGMERARQQEAELTHVRAATQAQLDKVIPEGFDNVLPELKAIIKDHVDLGLEAPENLEQFLADPLNPQHVQGIMHYYDKVVIRRLTTENQQLKTAKVDGKKSLIQKINQTANQKNSVVTSAPSVGAKTYDNLSDADIERMSDTEIDEYLNNIS